MYQLSSYSTKEMRPELTRRPFFFFFYLLCYFSCNPVHSPKSDFCVFFEILLISSPLFETCKDCLSTAKDHLLLVLISFNAIKTHSSSPIHSDTFFSIISYRFTWSLATIEIIPRYFDHFRVKTKIIVVGKSVVCTPKKAFKQKRLTIA